MIKVIQMNKFEIARRNLFDLFYPTCCLGCNKRGGWFCVNCIRESYHGAQRSCLLCKKITNRVGQFCQRHRKDTALTGLGRFGEYDGKLKKAIGLIKFDYAWEGATELTKICMDLDKDFFHRTYQAIIPMAMSAKRLRQRGFNQSLLIAKTIGQKLSIPVVDSLSRIHRRPQVGLTRKERRENLKNAFSWKGSKLSGRVLLVDDVVTTGTTLNEASLVLRAAGASEIWGYAWAYDRLKK